MTLDDFLSFLAQIIYLLVAASTLSHWIRQRDQTRLDIALVFVSLALAFFAQDLQELRPDLAPLLGFAFFASLLAQPYYLLRVARYFQPTRPPFCAPP
jgi:hypothetical protein